MKIKIFYILATLSLTTFAQTKSPDAKEEAKAQELSKQYTHQGNTSFKSDKPIQAEVEYRNAIAENKDNSIAQYNLGTMYYKQKSYDEAFYRLKNASASTNISYEEKHKIFHNLGNTFMKEKAYDKAVMAYKEALRNNPKDEETRYNLAIAQDMLKKNPPPPQDDKKDNEQNKDNKNNQDQQQKENQDNQNDQNKDQGDNQKDPKQEEQDKNPNGEGDGKNQQPSSLSPKQMERILEAMNNEDQKTQEKINAQKAKGSRQKSEKDW
ncbi:MAG: tetratricopeptide repeat protein [Capnocytophaga sp.]|nr:tetratricopeptide repeat protein [Capnocytophaga sp.]